MHWRGYSGADWVKEEDLDCPLVVEQYFRYLATDPGEPEKWNPPDKRLDIDETNRDSNTTPPESEGEEPQRSRSPPVPNARANNKDSAPAVLEPESQPTPTPQVNKEADNNNPPQEFVPEPKAPTPPRSTSRQDTRRYTVLEPDSDDESESDDPRRVVHPDEE